MVLPKMADASLAASGAGTKVELTASNAQQYAELMYDRVGVGRMGLMGLPPNLQLWACFKVSVMCVSGYAAMLWAAHLCYMRVAVHDVSCGHMPHTLYVHAHPRHMSILIMDYYISMAPRVSEAVASAPTKDMRLDM